jgi:DASH complex subunit DAD2
MSLQNRPYSRASMMPTTPHTSTTQPPARFLPPHILTSRIAEKQAEFKSLSQLRDLSAGLAAQMESLESKLNCLADGTEGIPSYFYSDKGVADVLANWQNVFRAINLATGTS